MICCPDSIGLMNRSRKPDRDSLSTWPSPWWPLQIPLSEAVRPDHVGWRGPAFPRKLHERAARNVQDRRLCARGWTRRPLSFRLLGYVTRLMRALTSPCASRPCASSQYLRSFPKKAWQAFAFAIFLCPNDFLHFNSIERCLRWSYHRTQSMMYQMISTEPRARFTELASPANSERVVCSQASRSCTLDHFIHFLHLLSSKTPSSIGPEIQPRL